MKKAFFFLAASFFLGFRTVGSERIVNRYNYGEYTLSNGIEIFVLEDFSVATINIELSFRAGISAQTAENTGFFPLYSRLFKYDADGNEMKKLSAECSADSSRYRINCVPSALEDTLESLALRSFFPSFSDSAIKKEYEKMKEEILSYSETPASFLNSAIDSRVFSESPWKQESGIYPALFKGKTADEVRTVLKGISELWYTPQNASIFISGCMKKEKMLESCKKAFGEIRPSTNSLKAEPVKSGGNKRKFVIVSPDFSSNLTQIVVQFTSLGMTETDLMAAVLGAENSTMKNTLLGQKNLSIKEEEYIDAGAAHKNGSSRLIIQALMEEPVNKKVNIAPQVELFLSKLKEGIETSKEDEFLRAKKRLSEDFIAICKDSSTFMDYLSQFRAVEDFSSESEKSLGMAERMMAKPQLIQSQESEKIKEICKTEEPFVFVLLNSKVYGQNKKAFIKSGFSAVDKKNASWYSTELKKILGENHRQKENEAYEEEGAVPYEKNEFQFIEENRLALKTIRLKNGIPVTVKTTGATGNILIMVSLSLGKFSYNENPGFEKIITSAFAQNIQKEISKYRNDNILEGEPEILSETFNSYTAITVECAKEDAAICLRCISDAIIFGDIHPAEADSYVYSIRTQKRLYNASAVNQLSYKASRWLFKDGIIRRILDTESDVLEDTSYIQILNAYPSLLDSRLYRIIIVGPLDWEYLYEPLKNTFGLFTAHGKPQTQNELEKIDFPEDKAVKVKLRHVFTTDIKAEDAGPMPAVLVPTKNFFDPVQFWLEAPENSPDSLKNEVIYDALVFRLKEFLEEEAENEPKKDGISLFSELRLSVRTKEIPSSSFTFMSVAHTKAIDDFFKKTVDFFIKKLSEDESEISRVKESWVLNALKGTSILIRNGEENPALYLDSYETLINASKEDIMDVAQKYIIPTPQLRLYSEESAR